MNNINFDNPWLLFLGIPVLALVIISFIIAIRKENKTINNTISFVFHIIICILLFLSLAKTTYEVVITETNIYVLADVSYSSHNNLDLIDEYIDNLQETTPKNSKIGIVCFGKDYELLVKPGEEIISVKNSTVDNSATNIVDALEYTATLFEDNVIKRIVIISDGEETKDSNIVSVVQALSSDNIYIDAIYLDNNIKEDTKEIQINQIDYTEATYLNENEKVSAIIQSSFETRVFVKLYCDDVLLEEKAVSLNKGYNAVSLNLNTKTQGDHQYEIEVVSEEDTSSYNNSLYFNQNVAEKLKVLFISEDKADELAAQNLYGDSAEIDYFINNYEIPYTVEELCVYDEFVLSNVDVRNIYNYSQFVNSLDILVSEFGKSLVTLGNTYIQNNEDDETMSALSDMLPVKFGNNDQEDKLITIVLDISRSMEQADRLNMAKEICYGILDNLKDEVTVMVIAFFGDVGTVYDPTPVSERELIKQKIKDLQPYQGTFMGAALNYAYKFISSLSYSKNEIILISDGLPYGEQENAARAIVTKMAQDNIQLSAIHTLTKEGAKLMQDLATIGRGYYYYIASIKDVESLVLNEVMNSLTETVLESNESPVSILLQKEQLVKDVTELPNVKGLYKNFDKSGSKVVLNSTYTDLIGNSYNIPLYTYWNYGNGKVSSFASSISGEWISNWDNNEQANLVLQRILEVNKPTERISSAFIIDVESSNTDSKIIVDAPSINKNSVITIKVTNPDNSIIEKQLVFDSQFYTTEINTEKVGKYVIELNYTFGELSYSTTYIFNISYLPEYNSFTVYEASSLYYMVSTNGQISEDGKLELVNDNSNEQKYIMDFTPIFMILCVLLFVSDVIVRKLRWQDIKSLFKKQNKVIKEGGSK